MSDNKVKLYQKIQAVSMEIKNIEKDMTVGTGNYSYQAVSDQQVTLLVKEAEKKNKLLSVPVKQELISHDVHKIIKKNGDEGLTYVDNIKMTVEIVDLETGESIEIESFGKGIDSGDKGLGKASTYARKYALLNAYKIATGEDPDAHKSEEQTAPKSVSEKRQDVMNYLNMDTDRLSKAMEHFGAPTPEDFSDKDIETMWKGYKQKKLI